MLLGTPFQKNKHKRLVAASLVSTVSSIAAAQPADLQNNAGGIDVHAISLPAVIVTATRTEIEISDAPAAVTLIERRDMEVRNTSRPGDLLKTVPSLYTGPQADGLVNRASGGTGALTLRGVPSNRSLVLLDGQSIQSASSGSLNWRAINVDEIERVEVVPGAFSALYGSGAVGGVVNMITKKPDQREVTARWKHGVGDGEGDDLGFFYRNHFDSGMGIMASTSLIRRKDYKNDAVVVSPSAGAPGTSVTGAQPVQTPSGANAYQVGLKARSPWSQDNAGIKVTYDAAPENQWFAGYQVMNFRDATDGWESWLRDVAGNTVTSGTLGVDGKRLSLAQSNFVNTLAKQSTQRFYGGFDGIVGSDNRLHVELSRLLDESNSQVIGSSSVIDGGAGRMTLTPTEITDLNVQLSRPLSDHWFMVSGVSIREASVAQRQWSLTNWQDNASQTTLNEGYNGRSTNTALYSQLEWIPVDSLSVYFGGRFDQWETSGSYFRTTPAPYIADIYKTRTESAFTPKISAVIKASESLTLRASGGTSFQAPGNLDLYARSFHGPTVHLNDPNLKPERGVSWEVGAEQQLSPLAKVGMTYFTTRLRDMISLRQISSTQRQISNIGVASIRGLELIGRMQIGTGVTFLANYSRTEALTELNEADPASVGMRLASVPDQLFYVGVAAERDGWTGAVDLKYTGKVYASSDNSDVVQGVPGSYDRYAWVDVKVGKRLNSRTKLMFGIQNLLDRKAYQSILLPGRTLSTELVMSL